MTCQPAFFALLFLLLGVPDIYSLLVLHSLLPLFKTSFAFLSCYILALPVVFLPERPKRFYKAALLVFAGFFFFVDIYLLLLYNETFGTITKDAIAAVLATNPDETVEYIDTYFTIDNLLILSAIFSVVFVLFYYLRKLRFKWNYISRCVVLIFLLFSASISLRQFNKVKDSNLYYLITKECPDLREYRQNPSVICAGERVGNIVLIIGESFAKSHSSLYGYDKSTNPLLGKRREKGLLYVYDNVKSACITTIPAIKSLITSYTKEMGDSIKWYECLTLLEVMQNAGYETFWISNQAKTGFHENETGRFADLCDNQMFVNDNATDTLKYVDEALLPLLLNAVNDDGCNRFFVLHMMGSHANYSSRYPADFAVFDAYDYSESHSRLSAYNRSVVAEYDNSILYNDSIVCEILNEFEDDDAVVVYLSDHGEDIFITSDNYFGHGIPQTQEVCYDIPFMVYTSELFREKHPELQRRIENSVNRPYRTDSIMYTIMDIAGVETVNGVSYKHKSLFK